MIDKSAGVLTPEIIFNTADNDNDGLIDIIEFFELMQL
jgi:hypothetical protein